ncbi:MAG: hypothetical protein ABIA63_11630 [bacterium]
MTQSNSQYKEEMSMRIKYILIAAICLLAVSIAFTAADVQKITPTAKVFSYYHLNLSAIDASEVFSDRESKFDFSRIYAGVKYQLSDDFMAEYLTDAGRQDKTGQLELFTKYAYLDWKLGFLGAHLSMGLQGTYNWKQPEKMWGCRGIQYAPMESFHKYFGKVDDDYIDLLESEAETLLDTSDGNVPSGSDIRRAAELATQAANFESAKYSGMGASADIGVALNLKPTKEFYLDVMVRNGGGYKNAENDFFKNIQMRTGYYLLDKALHISGYFELEPYKGYDNEIEKTVFNNIQWDAAVSYEKKDLFTAGLNVNSKIFSGSYENITAMCVSGFGHVFIKKKVKALARYDHYITGINGTKAVSDAPKTNAGLIIAGLDYIPLKGVNIIPNVQIWTYEDEGKDKDVNFYVHLLYSY